MYGMYIFKHFKTNILVNNVNNITIMHTYFVLLVAICYIVKIV